MYHAHPGYQTYFYGNAAGWSGKKQTTVKSGPLFTGPPCCTNPVHDDLERRSVYQNIQFFICSKTDVLNVATF